MPNLRIPLCLVIVGLLLIACEQVSSNACPPVPDYTSAEQALAADEIEALPQVDVMIPRLLGDYRVMRAQARDCMGNP